MIARAFQDSLVADLAEALQDAPAGASVRIPDAAFQVVTLAAYQPWMTGAVVYAEQFWAFDCVGLREPG